MTFYFRNENSWNTNPSNTLYNSLSFLTKLSSFEKLPPWFCSWKVTCTAVYLVSHVSVHKNFLIILTPSETLVCSLSAYNFIEKKFFMTVYLETFEKFSEWLFFRAPENGCFCNIVIANIYLLNVNNGSKESFWCLYC